MSNTILCLLLCRVLCSWMLNQVKLQGFSCIEVAADMLLAKCFLLRHNQQTTKNTHYKHNMHFIIGYSFTLSWKSNVSVSKSRDLVGYYYLVMFGGRGGGYLYLFYRPGSCWTRELIVTSNRKTIY